MRVVNLFSSFKGRLGKIQQRFTRGPSSQLLQVLQSRKPRRKIVGSSSQLFVGQSQHQALLHFFGQFQNRTQIKTKISEGKTRKSDIVEISIQISKALKEAVPKSFAALTAIKSTSTNIDLTNFEELKKPKSWRL